MTIHRAVQCGQKIQKAGVFDIPSGRTVDRHYDCTGEALVVDGRTIIVTNGTVMTRQKTVQRVPIGEAENRCHYISFAITSTMAGNIVGVG